MKHYLFLLLMLTALTLSAEPMKTWTTDSGLKIEVLQKSDSTKIVEQYDFVTMHYEGWLLNGRKFDSSIDPDTPITFMAGMGKMIAGIEEGLIGMRPGEIRRVIIPPSLGYGDIWYQNVIPPNSVLDFKIYLLSVTKHKLNLEKKDSESDSSSDTQ